MRLSLRFPRSLRGRLLVATVVLVAVGLVVIDSATYAFSKSFLVSRVDQQLRSESSAVDQVLDRYVSGDQSDPFGPGPGGLAVPPGTWGCFLDTSGNLIKAVRFVPSQGEKVPAPHLPPSLPGSTSNPNQPFRYLTASGGGVRYRVLAAPLVNGSGGAAGTLVVAIPLRDVSDTLHHLLLIEVLGTLGVLLLVGGLGWWLVRRGLRPLDDIAETAGAIAAGDLSQRVPDAEPSTEVGRLGLALNAMLGQIEGAFAERTASEERLRRFVADASHELRTPLTSIRGYSELFHRGAADRPEDLAKAMERIEAEASRMGVLVDDLLLLARLDQGASLVRHRVDLAGLASRSVQDARAADPSRSISLHGDGPVVVEGDEGRLKQVLDNLLANARVHTPLGTPARVTVSSDGRAVVDVADDGPGVPPGVAGRIFERFYRSDASRSRERGGAGLGLAIASEIARAHGGELSLLETDRGAAFRLSLPLASS